MRAIKLALIGALMSGTAVQAGGDALVIGNSRYDAIQTFLGAGRMATAADSLRKKGFDVTDVQDGGVSDMNRAFFDFVRDLEPGDSPVVIVLAGAFAHGPMGAYLLPVANRKFSEAQILARAFQVDAALSILAQYPGRAVLMLGESSTDAEFGPFLKQGIGPLDVPQGVTVVRGAASDLSRFAPRVLGRTGGNLRDSAERYELTIEGYAPADFVVVRPEDVTDVVAADADLDVSAGLDRDDPSTQVVVVPKDPDPAILAADEAAWSAAQTADSRKGYQAYLNAYPDGVSSNAARQRLQAIADEPFYAQRRTEERLEMDRDTRREVQRALSILGYDTRGIDGIFGSGTRGAIKDWQTADGRLASGYLNPKQIKRLGNLAATRAKELEAEAKRKKAELDKADRAAWKNVERNSDEKALRAYLDKFPEGLFAGDARTLLKTLEKQREERAAEQDARDWRDAKDIDTLASYRAYIKARPTGTFVADAKTRIADLQRAAAKKKNVGNARSEEQALGLNPVARRLAEAKLAQLGLKPGKVDGTFDDATRQAIRRYQTARSMRVSGFLDEQTVIRLLADGVLGD